MRNGNAITVKLEKPAGEMKLSVYDGAAVKETAIPVGVTEYTVEV